MMLALALAVLASAIGARVNVRLDDGTSIAADAAVTATFAP